MELSDLIEKLESLSNPDAKANTLSLVQQTSLQVRELRLQLGRMKKNKFLREK